MNNLMLAQLMKDLQVRETERQSNGYDRREKIVLKKCGEGESELNTLIAVVQHN
jgi:hypothetical protein